MERGGGERGPVCHPDRPSWSCLCCRVPLLRVVRVRQSSGQLGRWVEGRSRCGRDQHGSYCWGSGADPARVP